MPSMWETIKRSRHQVQSLWARLGWLVKTTVSPPNCHVHCVANDLDSYLGLVIAAKQLVNQKLIPVAKNEVPAVMAAAMKLRPKEPESIIFN